MRLAMMVADVAFTGFLPDLDLADPDAPWQSDEVTFDESFALAEGLTIIDELPEMPPIRGARRHTHTGKNAYGKKVKRFTETEEQFIARLLLAGELEEHYGARVGKASLQYKGLLTRCEDGYERDED